MKFNLTTTKRSISPWVIWGLGALFFFTEYFTRISPSVMAPMLQRDLNVSAYALGSLSAFFYWAYLAMQIPVGMLIDRYGPHRLLTVMAALCAVACFMFAHVHHLWLAEVSRFLTGFAASFAFVGALKLASMWFSLERLGLLAGLTQGLGMLGAAVGDAPVALTVAAIGWRQTMNVIAWIFIVLAIAIGLFVRDKKLKDKHQLVSLAHVTRGLMTILSRRETWLNALYAALIYAPTASFAELWGPSFLHTSYHLSNAYASFANSFIFIGWVFGGPLLGYISDKLKRRRLLQIISAICGGVAMVMIIYVPMSMSFLIAILFFYGLTNAGVALAYARAGEMHRRQYAGMSIAFANMASVLIGAALQPIIGRILDLYWSGKVVQGVPVYSIHDFHLALCLLPLSSFLGMLVALTLRDNVRYQTRQGSNSEHEQSV